MLGDLTIEHILSVLNRALEVDPAAMQSLLANRVPCNDALLSDLTIQCTGYPPTVGVLGLINGICGVDEHNIGPIAAVLSAQGTLKRFERTVTCKRPPLP